RLYLMKDAWKIISSNIWLGTGGQGWDAYYLKYQTYAYYAENIHDAFLQTWLEAGVFGFIAFLGIWLTVLFNTLKIKAAPGITKVYSLFLWTLAFHSIMDFDMTYGAISLIFWAMAGVVANESQGEPAVSKGKRKYRSVQALYQYGAVSLCVFLILFTGILIAARNYYDQSKVLLAEGATPESITALEKSLSLDPYNINTLVRLSKLNYQLAGAGPSYLRQSIFYARQAVQVKPSEPMGHYVLAQAYMASGKVELSTYELEQYVKYHPNLLQAYESLSEGYLAAARSYLAAGDTARGRQYLFKVRAVVEQVRAKKGSYPPDVYSLWQDEPVLDVSQNLMSTLREADILLKGEVQ
ncbi:MAG: O-antigen ligase family protein, partial [Firmicutes bacterium]|nr:O-antigen ligase family protein [Bacillota bacterium]